MTSSREGFVTAVEDPMKTVKYSRAEEASGTAVGLKAGENGLPSCTGEKPLFGAPIGPEPNGPPCPGFKIIGIREKRRRNILPPAVYRV